MTRGGNALRPIRAIRHPKATHETALAYVGYLADDCRKNRADGDMVTFTFYIRDDRYDVPTMDFVIAQNEARARVRAAERLLESTHHTAVEVYEGDSLRFSMTAGSGAEPPHH